MRARRYVSIDWDDADARLMDELYAEHARLVALCETTGITLTEGQECQIEDRAAANIDAKYREQFDSMLEDAAADEGAFA